MALLEALLDADGQPVAKARLFELAWPGTIVEEVNLSVQIAALRRALGQDSSGREWITTVPRVGYCLPRQGETSPAPTGLRRASIVVLPFTAT
jgi:DNA-binding winged helix-turn-helix (wHTH) protein